MKKNYPIVLIVFLVIALLVGTIFLRQKKERELTSDEFLMDTLISISTYGTDTDFLQKAMEKAFQEMRRIADLTNRFPLSGTTAAALSDVVSINENAGIKPVVVDKDVFKMLQLAQAYNRLTEGAFDVTIGPLMDLWGFGREKQKVPTAGELEQVLTLVDSEKLILNQEEQSAFLSEKGMSLDLGAVAKGYAVEKAAQVLRKEGVEKALINAGGNIRVIGEKVKRQPWKIGIQDPRDSSALIGILSLEDEATATSGDYNRMIKIAGKNYHHLLSPQTGCPVGYNMGVTVVTRDAGQADLLSTALFLLEPQQALELVAKLSETEVVIVTADQKILVSPGLQGKIELRPRKEYSYD
jgi:thiamine biosynthesis lipoprotein